MHKDPGATEAFLEAFLELRPPGDYAVILFPPAVSLGVAARKLEGAYGVGLGVQNVHWEVEGAFTGETSAGMARAIGARYALVGHSERRHLFGESVEETSRKLAAALRAGLSPVLCLGETLDERRAGEAEVVVERHLSPLLEIPEEEREKVLVAYEPVWAIGTGETASPEDAEAMHGFVRSRLAASWGNEAAAGVPVLYGGSVKPGNAADLLAGHEVDGVLVGGASLDPGDFAAICRTAVDIAAESG